MCRFRLRVGRRPINFSFVVTKTPRRSPLTLRTAGVARLRKLAANKTRELAPVLPFYGQNTESGVQEVGQWLSVGGETRLRLKR
jgi:hypothetical protein